MEIEGEEIGAFARLQRADIGAAEDAGTPQRGELEHLARRHPFIRANRVRLR
jgi:hypothetical protein